MLCVLLSRARLSPWPCTAPLTRLAFRACTQEEEEEEAEEEEEEEEQQQPKKKGKGGGGFGEAYLKPALATFMGRDSAGRSEVIKEIWRHVKELNLQDPKDKRYIVCDERLFAVFQKKRIHMFGMNKDLTKHYGERVGNELPAKKSKAESDGSEEEEDDDDDTESSSGKRKAAPAKAKPAKKSKGGGGGFQAPVRLSDELQQLLGSGETLPRTEVVKQLWAYIKANDRQNPSNKKEIIPDSKMKPVFGKDKFTVCVCVRARARGRHMYVCIVRVCMCADSTVGTV